MPVLPFKDVCYLICRHISFLPRDDPWGRKEEGEREVRVRGMSVPRPVAWNGSNRTYFTNIYNSFLPCSSGRIRTKQTQGSFFYAVCAYGKYLILSEQSHLCVWHLNNISGELSLMQKEKKQQYCFLVREEFVTWSFGNGVSTPSLQETENDDGKRKKKLPIKSRPQQGVYSRKHLVAQCSPLCLLL